MNTLASCSFLLRRTPRVAVLMLIAAVVASAQPARQLERGFLDPPNSARPHTWWHWMDGNVTKEGITLDLEEMARVGIGGAQIFDVAVGIPPGPARYNSPEWRTLVKHALQEAERLGLEICMHNCAGWSSSGAPWITPEHAMQMLVVTEKHVQGPANLDEVLPQPETRWGYYRDVAVLAFKTPSAEVLPPEIARPTVTANVEGFDASRVMDGDPTTQSGMALVSGEEPAYLQFEYPQPFTARSLVIIPGSGNGQGGDLQASDDGVTFHKICNIYVPQPNLLRCPTSIHFDPVTARFFRLVFPRPSRRSAQVNFAEIVLTSGARLSNYGVKAGYDRGNPPPDRWEVAEEGLAIDRSTVVDLTSQMDAAGRLQWHVPPGDWTILRFGHTPTGKNNHPAAEDACGPECDKLSREAAAALWAGMLDEVIAEVGPLAGKSFKHVLIDSYEVDCQNWTPRFREEFQKRRGYDPWPYLPAMTGRVVHSVSVTERFLWDIRRTIADLYADNYWGYFAERCHEHGMELSTEPYGNGNFDELTAGGRADIPMSEFWVGSSNDNSNSKLASSIAHTYGRKFVGAESFTASDVNGRWQNHPYALKALGDFIWCGGVNRFIFHRYAHQPWVNLKPGMTMGPWGFHCERTVTWWDPGRAWMKYLARSQYLLQEGRFVADLCYFVGEGSPAGLPGRSSLRPAPPPGYDYDGCDTHVLLTRMSVKEGRLVLPDGMNYIALVLPPNDTMTPPVLRKIAALVRAGALVMGPKPSASPSLQDYPRCDEEVAQLAQEVWGPCDGQTVTEHPYGKGRIIWGKPLEEVLQSVGLVPDFEYAALEGSANLAYIHRVADGADVYFVSNQLHTTSAVECTFRVAGKRPELWHPDTGQIEDAPVYRVENGRTVVPLRIEPAGSVFVVFRRPDRLDVQLLGLTRNGEPALHRAPPSPHTLEIREAVYGVLQTELPNMVEVTQQLRALVKDGVLEVRASNDLAGDPAPNIVKQMRVEYILHGQPGTVTVLENQLLRLPREGAAPGALEIRRAFYGLIPEGPIVIEPRTVDVTRQVAALVKDGRLSVKATNDLAGDPAHLVVKQLRVDYLLDGELYSKTVNENQLLELPTGMERGISRSDLPFAELSLDAGSKPILTAWQPGTYEVQTAAGRTLRVEVPAVIAPLEVAGPWELSFPPKLGAPEHVTLETLISWTKHDDPGVRYFSGTATYTGALNIPEEAIGQGKVLRLDLGTVREIAEVQLNGQDLGILWKPPFRVDVTHAARAGRNTLQVRVTNLWPNRLIGDEQLPPDCEYRPGGPLLAWPEWLLKGQPRPSGRIAFTTWQHWTKDSPLIESGLLGPVRVYVGEEVALR
ncbi:MAG: glycosyl hydrolase [Candidatus Zipacnadales bacterium]